MFRGCIANRISGDLSHRGERGEDYCRIAKSQLERRNLREFDDEAATRGYVERSGGDFARELSIDDNFSRIRADL